MLVGRSHESVALARPLSILRLGFRCFLVVCACAGDTLVRSLVRMPRHSSRSALERAFDIPYLIFINMGRRLLSADAVKYRELSLGLCMYGYQDDRPSG